VRRGPQWEAACQYLRGRPERPLTRYRCRPKRNCGRRCRPQYRRSRNAAGTASTRVAVDRYAVRDTTAVGEVRCVVFPLLSRADQVADNPTSPRDRKQSDFGTSVSDHLHEYARRVMWTPWFGVGIVGCARPSEAPDAVVITVILISVDITVTMIYR
jgi:hypothetical protein